MSILGRLFGAEKLKLKAKAGDATIEITEKDGTKTLRYNGTVYSRLKKDSVFTHEYWDYFIPLAYTYPNPHMLAFSIIYILPLDSPLPSELAMMCESLRSSAASAVNPFTSPLPLVYCR